MNKQKVIIFMGATMWAIVLGNLFINFKVMSSLMFISNMILLELCDYFVDNQMQKLEGRLFE